MTPGGDVWPNRFREPNAPFVNSNGEVVFTSLSGLLSSTFILAKLSNKVRVQLAVPNTRIDQAVRNIHQ